MKHLGHLLLIAGFAAMTLPTRGFEARNEITPQTIVDTMNVYRASEGLPPLRIDERLAAAAGDRMRHMEEEEFWSHESPQGLTPFLWISARAYDYQFAGENLASGFETVGLLVSSWMESPGHRANILSSNYADCGISVIDGATTGPAMGKSIVVLFAREQKIPTIALVPRQVDKHDGGERGVRRH